MELNRDTSIHFEKQINHVRSTQIFFLWRSKLDHYYLIKNFNRLMFDITKYKGKTLCLQCFSQIRILNEWMELCKHNETSRFEMYSKKVLKYTNFVTRLKLLMWIMRTWSVLFKNTINTFHYVLTDDKSQMV